MSRKRGLEGVREARGGLNATQLVGKGTAKAAKAANGKVGRRKVFASRRDHDAAPVKGLGIGQWAAA